jgi:hypothetical protein
MDSEGGEYRILWVIEHALAFFIQDEESPDQFGSMAGRNHTSSVIDGHNGIRTATGLIDVDTKREIRRARYSGPIVPMEISADDGCESPTRGVLNP